MPPPVDPAVKATDAEAFPAVMELIVGAPGAIDATVAVVTTVGSVYELLLQNSKKYFLGESVTSSQP